MSSQALVWGNAGLHGGVAAAWETDGQVFFGDIDLNVGAIPRPVAAPGEEKGRKHPTLAVDGLGKTLMAWTEGTGWQRGGDLVWQFFDREGRPTDEKGRIVDGIPVWSFPAAIRSRGSFLLIH